MDSTVLLTSLSIMVARCIDASLGTLRTVSIIQGHQWHSDVLASAHDDATTHGLAVNLEEEV